jgi:pyrroloquinoline-quinone synthase
VTAHLLPGDELEAALRRIGEERYHHRHPFHHLMRDGQLTRGQVQAWALNRYYYQARIPAKDAHLVARLPTPALRREWRRRIIDHEGYSEDTGGIERWLILCVVLGLYSYYVIST